MKIKPFATEEFFADYEFSAPYMLSASDCESMTIEALMQCAGVGLDGLGACSLQYTESQGGRVVREAIASTYDAVSADDVIMLNAPQEGIYLAMNALLEPRDRVLVLTPCYDSLVQVAEHIGCEMHRLHLIAASFTIAGRLSVIVAPVWPAVPPKSRPTLNFSHILEANSEVIPPS